MKNALRELPRIIDRVSKHGCVLMLDFDGTLSPIVMRPQDAALSKETRDILHRAARRYPVAIISGRSLEDIRVRVGIDRITYAGDHGYQWLLRGKRYEHRVPDQSLALLKQAQTELVVLQDEFLDLIIERKPVSIALNYRSLSDADQKAFRIRASEITAPYEAQGLRVIDSMLTFELLADAQWSKGKCAELLLDVLRDDPEAVAIYIGDSLTDEDVFRAFEDGITIRVGKDDASAARYYVSKRGDVDTFIAALLQISGRD